MQVFKTEPRGNGETYHLFVFMAVCIERHRRALIPLRYLLLLFSANKAEVGQPVQPLHCSLDGDIRKLVVVSCVLTRGKLTDVAQTIFEEKASLLHK